MNRAMMRASKEYGRKLMKKGWNKFEDATQEAINRSLMPSNCLRIFKNNMYIVQIYNFQKTEWGNHSRVGIRKNDGSANVFWSDIQRIKNEIFGEEAEAIQVFPTEQDLVDQANMYWIYVMHDGIPFNFYGEPK